MHNRFTCSAMPANLPRTLSLPVPRFCVLFLLLTLPLAGDTNLPVPSASSTLIGNYHYSSVSAIVFVKDHAAAFVIDPGMNASAGLAAPDDSIHEVSVQGCRFDWGRVGDGVVARLTSDHTATISFKLEAGWPEFSSRFSAENNEIKGEAALARGGTVAWRAATSPQPASIEAGQFSVVVAPDRPVHLVAGFGKLPGFEGIDATLTMAREAYLRKRQHAAGPAGDFLGAIADTLNNSRMYSSDNHRVAITVSRGWTRGANGNPYFCWDSFFSALLASLDDPAMGRETVRAALSYQTVEGFVPNFSHWAQHKEGPVSLDRSQPPVGALCVWKMHLLHPDMDFLREVYPKLAKWHEWWMTARNAKHDGLLEWGSHSGTMVTAKYETGWDDSPEFEGAKMIGETMNAYAVDLNSLWAMDAHYLALMAETLGRVDEAAMYRQQEKEMVQRINEKLWNPELGIYCSRLWDGDDGKPGAFLTRLTPMNFYPMICHAPDENRARQMLAIMTDPNQFWGEWILPTVSRKDTVFPQQGYWHGTIWAPVNYLVFQGVLSYASPQLQADYAEKSVQLFMRNWTAEGVAGENYSSITGLQHGKGMRSDPHYTWAALLCLIGLESLVHWDDQGVASPGAGINQDVELSNVPWGGSLHGVKAQAGKVSFSPAP